jgi:hypothetical protein
LEFICPEHYNVIKKEKIYQVQTSIFYNKDIKIPKNSFFLAELCVPQTESEDKELYTSPLPQFPAVFIFKQPLQSSFSSYQDEYGKDLMLQGISVKKNIT